MVQKKINVKDRDISKLTLDDLSNEQFEIGVLMGSSVESELRKRYKNIEIKYYNTNDDVYTAVETGILKYGMGYGTSSKIVTSENKHITYIEEPVSISDYCSVFPKTNKGKEYLDKYNLDEYYNWIN